MDAFGKEYFKYYCDELLKYRDEFTDEFFKDMELLTEDGLFNETSNIDRYRKKMFTAIDCLAVLINFYLGVPKKDSRKFIVRDLLPELSNNGKIHLTNINDNTKYLEYDANEIIFNLDENVQSLFEMYTKLHLIGSDKAFDI